MTSMSSRSHWLRWTAPVILVLIASALTTITYAMIAERIQPGIASVSTGLVETGTMAIVPELDPRERSHSSHTSAISDADGYIPDGETLSPHDPDHPAITNLDPDLLDAIQHAATDARVDGITMVINSGWRSERYQQALFDEAVVTYGSEEEAAKWVQTPGRSAHVTGDAVDIGDTDADYWLIEHGSDYGLCQTYANEIWHFERVVEPGEPCPTPVIDASASGHQHHDSLAGTESTLNMHGASHMFILSSIQPGGEQVVLHTAAVQQFVVGVAFDDPAEAHHHHLAHLPDHGEPVRDPFGSGVG